MASATSNGRHTPDSEAETERLSDSKNNTPMKNGQSGGPDRASERPADASPSSPDPARDSSDLQRSSRKRKATPASTTEASIRAAKGSDNNSGTSSKRVRLTQDKDKVNGTDDRGSQVAPETHDRKPNVRKHSPESAPATSDAAGDVSRHAETDGASGTAHKTTSQSPKSLVRKISLDIESASQRAATQEPRTRSESPSQAPHKRSASFQAAAAAGERERRLRSRRGAQETTVSVNESRTSSTPTNQTDPATPLTATMARGTNRDKSGRTALFRACEEGDVKKVREILHDVSNEVVELYDNAFNRPLQAAALEGRSEVVKLLLAHGCEVNCSNDSGDTPLIDAIDNGHVEVVKQLLDAGADPWQRNYAYEMPKDHLDNIEDESKLEAITALLEEATIQRSNQEAVESETVRQSEPPPRQSVQKDRLYPERNLAMMREACLRGDEGCVYDLKANARVMPDMSCAVAAARGGHVLPLQFLDKSGLNLDPDPAGVDQTPMLEAIGRGNLKVVQFLLELEDFNACRSVDGKSYYQLARERRGPRSRSEVKMLKRAYQKYRESKTSGDQASVPEASDGDLSEEEAPIPLSEPPPSSPMRLHGRRRRLVSGVERAEEQRHKVEDDEKDDDSARQTEPADEARVASEQQKVREASEAGRKAAEAQKARRAAEEEEQERARKAEEEEKARKAEEQEMARKAEEEELARKREEAAAEVRRLEAEEQARKAKEEEEERERIRKAEEEAERRRKEEEEKARQRAEAERIAAEEARKAHEAEMARLAALRAAEEARRNYIEVMPRGFRDALQSNRRIQQNRPSGADYAHMRTLADWMPIINVAGKELPDCPTELQEERWMPNFFASIFLHHDRLDECTAKLGWKTLPMTAWQRETVWNKTDGKSKQTLAMDQNWNDATPDKLEKECGFPVSIKRENGHSYSSLPILGLQNQAKEKMLGLPEDQLYWVLFSDFLTAVSAAPWLAGLEIKTRTGLHVSPKQTWGKSLPAAWYKDGQITKANHLMYQF